MVTFKISEVNPLVNGGEVVQIFIKKIGAHKKRIISFNPNKSELEVLMTIFEVNDSKEMEDKIFQVPEEAVQTNLAFEYLIKQGHL